MRNQRPFTPEELAFLKEHVPGRPFRELTRLFNERFGQAKTEGAIRNFCSRKGIHNGLVNFYKGHEGSNAYESGGETLGPRGFIMVKTCEKPRVWELKHHLIWKKHFGEIPENAVVLFADGDNRNFAVENLIMLTREEFLTLTGRKLLPKDADLMKSAALLAKLIVKARKAAKKAKK